MNAYRAAEGAGSSGGQLGGGIAVGHQAESDREAVVLAELLHGRSCDRDLVRHITRELVRGGFRRQADRSARAHTHTHTGHTDTKTRTAHGTCNAEAGRHRGYQKGGRTREGEVREQDRGVRGFRRGVEPYEDNCWMDN